MFRGDPRRPWIDISSEKIVQRHLGMVALQSYLNTKLASVDVIPAIDFLDTQLDSFTNFLHAFELSKDDILLPADSDEALHSYKAALNGALYALKEKRDKHPELFETDDETGSGKKSLLDALYEEGAIPTYSFPKNVVSTYISDRKGKLKYQVERGLDVAMESTHRAERLLLIRRLIRSEACIAPEAIRVRRLRLLRREPIFKTRVIGKTSYKKSIAKSEKEKGKT